VGTIIRSDPLVPYGQNIDPRLLSYPAANFALRWMLHRGRPRYVAAQSNVHVSVIERQKQVGSNKPRNLPKSVLVVQ
jgi:hypothetical protein